MPASLRPTRSRRRGRALVLAAASAGLTLALVVDAAPAAAAPQGPPIPVGWPTVTSATATAPVRISAGVSGYSETYVTVDGPEHTQVLTVDLKAHGGPRPGIVESHDRLYDPPNETTSSMGDRTGAVAGINGDFFAIHAAGTPLGAVVRSGTLLKTPRSPGFQAQLAVSEGGRATVGATGFTGTVRAGTASTAVTSVNTITDAAAGGITEVTPDLGAAGVPTPLAPGTLVIGTVHGSSVTVVQVVASTATVPALTSRQRALFGAGVGGAWLAAHVHAGDRLQVTAGLTDPHVDTLISGATVLVRAGAVYADPTGLPPMGRNPETMVGVSRDGRHLLLVVIDGRQPASSIGVTPTEAAEYLVAHGAWSGLLLDGGGSSTLAARLPGTASLTVLNTPSDATGERPVANGLFVYAR